MYDAVKLHLKRPKELCFKEEKYYLRNGGSRLVAFTKIKNLTNEPIYLVNGQIMGTVELVYRKSD